MISVQGTMKCDTIFLWKQQQLQIFTFCIICKQEVSHLSAIKDMQDILCDDNKDTMLWNIINCSYINFARELWQSSKLKLNSAKLTLASSTKPKLTLIK
jgi:hypothetical protein